MAWKVELSSLAEKNLDQLDPPVARRILLFLFERIFKSDDPRAIGESLKGARLGDLWKYRVGDYRIVCDLQDKVLCVLVVKIGNRREVYRQ
jgi:mRNA interferase RelE/StbE